MQREMTVDQKFGDNFQNHVNADITEIQKRRDFLDWKDEYIIISEIQSEWNFSYTFWFLPIFITSVNSKSNKFYF